MSVSDAGSRHATAPGEAAKNESLWTRLYRGLQTGVLDPVGGVVIIDVIVGALIVTRVGLPGLSNLPLPPADTAVLLLVAVSVFRRPRFDAPATLFFGLSCVGLLAYLVIVSWSEGEDFVRRGVRIAALMGLAIFIADGRINVRSLAFGVGLALAANAALFYAGIAPNTYGGALMGYLGDKNVAGFYYAVFALLIAGLATSRNMRIIILSLGVVLVFLTESRTSLAAFGAGVIWFAAGRLPAPLRAAAAAGLYFAFDFADNNLAQVGMFSDRTGSDLLRGRIDAASLEKLESAPWHGEGLGTATVQVQDHTWFFHNSYWALLVEGGWPFLVVLLGFFAFVVLLPRAASGIRSTPRIAIEAAAIAMLLCSFRLGEVFITIPSFFMLGCALFLLAEDRASTTGATTEPQTAGPLRR